MSETQDTADQGIDVVIGKIDVESKRIKATREATPAFLQREIASTVLSLLKDVALSVRASQDSVVPLFEVVTRHAEDIDTLFKEVATAGEDGSQLEEDDAKMFAAICEGLKILAGELLEGRAPAQDAEAKQKLRELVKLADDGLKLIDELTLTEGDEEGDEAAV